MPALRQPGCTWVMGGRGGLSGGGSGGGAGGGEGEGLSSQQQLCAGCNHCCQLAYFQAAKLKTGPGKLSAA
jgi:hypothetical protein